jgi:hypothetical protein
VGNGVVKVVRKDSNGAASACGPEIGSGAARSGRCPNGRGPPGTEGTDRIAARSRERRALHAFIVRDRAGHVW